MRTPNEQSTVLWALIYLASNPLRKPEKDHFNLLVHFKFTCNYLNNNTLVIIIFNLQIFKIPCRAGVKDFKVLLPNIFDWAFDSFSSHLPPSLNTCSKFSLPTHLLYRSWWNSGWMGRVEVGAEATCPQALSLFDDNLIYH